MESLNPFNPYLKTAGWRDSDDCAGGPPTVGKIDLYFSIIPRLKPWAMDMSLRWS
ncbi:hypothetical protein ACFCT7_09700 [Fulvivirgaceae bacterium LMO-SS25]